MLTSDEVKTILFKILRDGILTARAWGFAGEAKLAANEADHIHNLPELLQNFRLELLDHYLSCQMNRYLSMQAERVGRAAELMAYRDQLEQFLRDSNYVSPFQK